MNDTRCPVWSEHEFREPRFVEDGYHPIKGAWQKWRATCRKCPAEVITTTWPTAAQSQRVADV